MLEIEQNHRFVLPNVHDANVYVSNRLTTSRNKDNNQGQTWGQLLSNVIDYITITLQFSWLHYITITSIFKCNRLNYNLFVNVIDHYITDYI